MSEGVEKRGRERVQGGVSGKEGEGEGAGWSE